MNLMSVLKDARAHLALAPEHWQASHKTADALQAGQGALAELYRASQEALRQLGDASSPAKAHAAKRLNAALIRCGEAP